MTKWIPGDVSGSETLTDNDHLYPSHTNQLRTVVYGTAIVDPSGDGQFSDIQTAIDYVHSLGGGTVFLKEGTYEIDYIILLYDDVSVIGSGWKSVIKLADGVGTPPGIGMISFNDAHRIILQNFKIDGNGPNQSVSSGAVGITGQGFDVLVENINIYNTRAQSIGLIGSGENIIIRGCLCSYDPLSTPPTGSEGIFVTGSNISVVNNVINNCGDSGIIVERKVVATNDGSTDVTVANNCISNCGNTGIYIFINSRGVSVTGNTINHTAYGINFQQTEGIIVSSNTIYNSSNIALIGTTCARSVVTNNNIEVVTNAAIVLNGCFQFTCSNNNIYSCGNAGIWVDNSSHGVVANNMVLLATSYGIFCYGAKNIACNSNTVQNTISGAGIHISDGSAASSDITLNGNRCTDTQTPKTQTYGILSDGSSDYCTVVGNNCRGNLTGSISLAGLNNVNDNNIT